MNPIQLDESFNEFMTNLPSWVPEGIVDVDLELLEKVGLLTSEELDEGDEDEIEQLPHYFHVIESADKVTLFNHQFVVWIVPKTVDEMPLTYVFISLVKEKKPHLELAFSTAGVYNTPKFVLRLLRHYLSEVIDTEEAISSIKKT